MINTKLFLSIPSPGQLYDMTYKMDKCYISWKITNIRLIEKKKCSNTLNIKIEWKNNFLVSATVGKSNWLLCTGYNNFNLSKIWDEVNYLVRSEDFTLITDKYEDWNFILASGEILQQEINACEVEKIKIEKDTIYIWFIWILIFVLILLLFLLYKRILNK